MSEILSFPGLGWQFEINRVAFTVAGRPIYWYGIIVAAAFLAGAAYVLTRAKTFGLDGDRVMDVILGGVLLGIIGARIYYVLFRWDTYKLNPLSVFNIREGGVAIYGGIIGGVIAAIIMCKWRKVKLLPMLDLAAGGIILGQAIGRWGNFVNMEAFGINTTAKWGMTSPSIVWYLKQNAAEITFLGFRIDPGMPVHPTFFYESMWCLLGFLFIAWFTKRRRFDGEIGLIYLGWYGLGRFFIEGLRTDSLLFGTMRISQVLALICVMASFITLGIVLSKIRRSNDPDYMPLYVNTDEGKAVLAGEFYKKKDDAEAKDSDSGKADEPEESDIKEQKDLSETDDNGAGTEDDDSGKTEESPESDTKEPEAAGETAAEVKGEGELENGENN